MPAFIRWAAKRQIRVNGPIVVDDDEPTWFRLPGDARGVPAEEIASRRIVGRPNQPLLFFRKVAHEAHHTFRTHPDAAVGDFDVLLKLILLFGVDTCSNTLSEQQSLRISDWDGEV